jgi:penicillin-binding protein 2
MSFHPNDVIRRGRAATVIVCGTLVFLLSAFFRAQVIKNEEALKVAEGNRLRSVPLPAARGVIFDRKGQPIAENVIGYSVALLPQSEDSLRATLTRLSATVELTRKQFESAIARYRRDRSRPTVIIPDASFDVVSVLEEHRMDFPSLIIQSAPKRIYPAGKAVGAFAGYTAEISDDQLGQLAERGYKPGQQIGKQGLEKQYEAQLRGKEGMQFVEVDAKNRPVSRATPISDIKPQAAKPLFTNIDLDLQTYIASLFGDTLSGGVVALDPKTGGVLAIYSAPAVDYNRWVGGVSSAYFDSLNADPGRPLYNKALQGKYPPGSTWKLATSVIGLETNTITFKDHMPEPCRGFYYFGNRAWKCWEKRGHGSLDLSGAIAKSCDVYFYQLGLKLQLTRLVAGGVQLGFLDKTGIDLPEEKAPSFPDKVPDYFNAKFPRGWPGGSIAVNMSIGQGENAQTVLNMARFYAALANDGLSPTPRIAKTKDSVQMKRIYQLTPEQNKMLREALANVVSGGGTAAGAQIEGLPMAGKTGTAQTYLNGKEVNDAWFAGFAPANDPQIVVAIVLDNVSFHGSVTARLASAIMARYLKKAVASKIETEG